MFAGFTRRRAIGALLAVIVIAAIAGGVAFRAIKKAAAAVHTIYAKTVRLARSLPDDSLMEMDFPRNALDLLRIETFGMPDTVIGRLDLVRDRGGYKLLEFNSDAPGLLLETFSLSTKVCRESGADPVEIASDQDAPAKVSPAARASSISRCGAHPRAASVGAP
jgi:glutathionylspermidine synthase